MIPAGGASLANTEADTISSSAGSGGNTYGGLNFSPKSGMDLKPVMYGGLALVALYVFMKVRK